MRISTLTRKAFCGLLAASVIGVMTGIASAQPVKLRVGWAVTPGQLTPIIFDQPGIAKHLGKSYILEPIRVPGSAIALTMLAAGEIDIVNFTFTQLSPAIHGAGMTDLRIVLDEFRDGAPGYATNEYVVAKDGPIQKVEDLKGKVIAVPAIGTGMDVFMRAHLRRNGLVYPRDYTLIEAPLPTMKAMLLEKKADLAIGVKPFIIDPAFRGGSRTLFTQKEAVGPTDMLFLAAREPFIKKHRAALVDFFEDMIRATRWYMDPANHEQAIAIVSKFTKIPPPALAWAFTKEDFARDPDLRPDLASLQENVDMLKDLGLIKQSVDVKAHSDLSMLEEAVGRLKK